MPHTGSRILIIDDEPIASDVISGALMERGHHVEIVSDGFQAVERITRGQFDLALVDYHMPELDGLAAARLIRSVAHEGDRPRIVAVTGDGEGLASRPGALALFDAILAKPSDPVSLAAFVQSAAPQIRNAPGTGGGALDHWRDYGLSQAPLALTAPTVDRRRVRPLQAYFDLEPMRRPPDLLLVVDHGGLSFAQWFRSNHPDGHVTPVISAGDQPIAGADARFVPQDPASWRHVASVVCQFAARREMLSATVRHASDLPKRLIGYLAVSNAPFAPVRDGNSRRLMPHRGFFPETAVEVAERLAAHGLLSRQFADRVHVCSRCQSSRLNAREECPSCRSPALHETPLLHHFACAHQDVEAKFRQGSKLVCPKCRAELIHYGADYERTANALTCEPCGKPTDQPAVGFVCIDCGRHSDGEAMPTRDLHRYELSRLGRAFARTGPAHRQMPDGVSARISTAPKQALAVEIHYGGYPGDDHPGGRSGFRALRQLFVDNLRHLLRTLGEVVEGESCDYILMEDVSPAEFAVQGETLIKAAQRGLQDGLKPVLTIVPRDAVA